MMSLLRKSLSISLALAAVAVGLAATPVLADDKERTEGTFAVTFTRQSSADYCAASGGDVSIEAQGIGQISGIGPMFITVKKCFKILDKTYAGIFQLTDGNGDTVSGTYAGTQSPGDENGFGPFQGTLTVTGGTGKFRHASGALSFDAVAAPPAVGVATGKVVGTAYYLVRGSTSR